MKSLYTGKDMQLVVEKREMEFRKESFIIHFHCYQCEDTKETFESTQQSELNYQQVTDQYRAKHHIPFTEEIIDIRKRYTIPATAMSNLLGFGVNMYAKYEKGEIPVPSNGTNIALAASPVAMKSFIERCTDIDPKHLAKIESAIASMLSEKADPMDIYLQSVIKPTPSIRTGYVRFSKEKLFEMMSFFAGTVQPFKVKLNKLLWYADFLHFKLHNRGISGLQYQALPMGPVPTEYQTLFDMARHSQSVQIDKYEFNTNSVGEQFVQCREFNPTVFRETELSVLKHVTEVFRSTSTARIQEISHEENGWIDNESNRDVITYDYAYELKNI